MFLASSSELDEPVKLSNFINNVFVPTEKGIESFNPSNGKLLYIMPDSGKTETDMAVEAALLAFKTWSMTSVRRRAQLLNRIADEIEARIDQGKPLSLSTNVEIPRVIENFRFFAAAILNHKNESTENTDNSTLNFTTQVYSSSLHYKNVYICIFIQVSQFN